MANLKLIQKKIRKSWQIEIDCGIIERWARKLESEGKNPLSLLDWYEQRGIKYLESYIRAIIGEKEEKYNKSNLEINLKELRRIKFPWQPEIPNYHFTINEEEIQVIANEIGIYRQLPTTNEWLRVIQSYVDPKRIKGLEDKRRLWQNKSSRIIKNLLEDEEEEE